jgi:cellobiose phosphorylase
MQFGYYRRHEMTTFLDEDSQAVVLIRRCDQSPLVGLASSLPLAGWDGDRNKFVGVYRTEQRPLAVEQGQCTNQPMPIGDPCAAVQNRLSIPAGGEQRVTYSLTVSPVSDQDYDSALAALREDTAYLRTPEGADQQRERLSTWWTEHFERMQCDVPDPAAMRMINTWTPVNTVHTGRYSRAINSWAPGTRGIGFRDTCQDMLSVSYRDPAWATRTLMFLLTQQFPEGYTAHYCYPEEGEPPWADPHCDDHLWLPLLTWAIVAETGDASLLEQRATWLALDGSDPGEATVWEHLVRGIHFTMDNRGAHRLPLLFHADWNDSLTYGRGGKGESVFAAQQGVVAIDRMLGLADWCGRYEADVEFLRQARGELVEALLA